MENLPMTDYELGRVVGVLLLLLVTYDAAKYVLASLCDLLIWSVQRIGMHFGWWKAPKRCTMPCARYND